ncbi:hypothetical protein FisN_1Hh392 [Fistulifera solaris]|uniref:Uncharacterized protein n=1 Tax=Fistulifera solaris TaxID=1519565 RepID=A0A1Z5KGU9_FISSO|nr:hypothetical protein FisN_1Hh392 [Fistulifera solaris]|eukprot:GAX25437.1 hypothetical protein FisN_1Hh392 [Fistulifera solaris]
MPNTSKQKSTKPKNDTSNVESAQKARLRKELDTLHQEMEVARYATIETGHQRRKVPKHQSKARTRQRKHLEKIDHEEIFAYDEQGEDVPIRGAAAAHTADVINGSLIFGVPGKPDEQQDGSDDGGDSSEDQQSDDDSQFSGEDENEESASEDDTDESDTMEENVDEDFDDDDEDEDEDLEVLEEAEDTDNGIRAKCRPVADDLNANEDGGKQPGKKRKNKFQGMSNKRRRYRMKNFKSFRMAQRHGEALAAHARGNPSLAIQKLKAIAQDHPSAPQIYSSLGMIYEEMLQDQKAKVIGDRDGSGVTDGLDQGQEDDNSSLIALATKMYGSFHVAAYLCTKDYALWERAANAAIEISALHTEMMAASDASNAVREYHRSAKVRWLSEAKSDYYRATKLNPPGIEVACKLAATLVELGHLSEALTLLTDLKNHADKAPSFNASHGAWLLYADLMLQIGHECSKWNSGNQSNGNHMFRRWLRKMSKTFNWEERRLQALVKALEAAAGSNNCGALLSWMHERALSMSSNTGNGLQGQSDFNEITDAEIEAEKEIAMKRNNEELEDFDRVTAEMKAVTDSKGAHARQKEREHLLETQRTRLENIEEQQTMARDEDGSTPLATSYETAASLPMSSSCRTVCTIATDLVRQALSMGIATIGKLACEAFCSYLKERSEITEKRIADRQASTQSNLDNDKKYRHRDYDNVEELSDGYVSDVAFSDDEELNHSNNPALLQSLKYGSLPPELRFLYGICLAAEGGKRFLAMRCIEIVNSIGLEDLDWFNEDINDTAAVQDTSWQVLLKCTTAPLTRTAAYALLGDVLKKRLLDIPLYDLSRLLSEHARRLIDLGIVKEALAEQSKNSLQSRRRRLVIDVLVTTARIQLQHVEEMMSTSLDSEREKRKELVLNLLESLTAYLRALWNIDSRAAVCTSCREILIALAVALRLLLVLEEDFQEMCSITTKVEAAISILCGVPNLQSTDNELYPTDNLRSLPFDSAFQSDSLKKLSLRVHNCAVATNCSHFSGWEASEFSTALLKSVDISYFSGISVENGHTFGILNDRWVPILARQWETLAMILPNYRRFDFAEQFKAASTRDRYVEVRKSMEEATKRDKLCIYGEESGVEILLSYSELCLRLASISSARNRDLSSQMLYKALSIILPLSQFALHQELWTSTLGTVAACQTGLIEWRPITTRTDGAVLPSYLLPTESRSKGKSIESSLDQWFDWENDQTPLANLIPIEPANLLSLWKMYAEKIPSSSEKSRVAMQQLDESLKQMRLCFSEQAVENQSLIVAAKLLDVATCADCANPFLCIFQAARFARHSRKGGSSSDVFKVPLALEVECTSRDVVAILGRAGCLQSLYCFHEAAFLYSFIAGVCAVHRKTENGSVERNDLWKALSILNYNQTVRLRASFRMIVKEHGIKDEPLFVWKGSVIDELNSARIDGLALQPHVEHVASVPDVLLPFEDVQPGSDFNIDVNNLGASEDESKAVTGEPIVVAV